MATGIISLVTALLGLVFWWIKRRAAAADDPMTQNEKRYEQIDEDIAAGLRRAEDSTPYHGQVNASADLDELERLQRAKVVMISADQAETMVTSNQVFRVPSDGVFMPAARYQRYRRAVADKIQELETK